MHTPIAEHRLDNQRISRRGPRRPEDVVAWFGAMQAQEYPAAKWAIALRMSDRATDAAIERALEEGRILRTHLMRPTWHFVPASDLHWMLDLTAPRVHRALAYGYRQFELDVATRTRAASAFEQALGDGRFLTRAELGAHAARAGVVAKGVRLALLTVHAELEQVICSGPQLGTRSTYVLLASRITSPRRLQRDEALAELTTRYFRSHGPATIRDFVWWSGLTAADAKRGLEMGRARHEVIDGRAYWTLRETPARKIRSGLVHLLPIYDEYLVAYRDLEAVPRPKGLWGILPQAVIADGQVVGEWKCVTTASEARIDVTTLRALSQVERDSLRERAQRYGRFLKAKVAVDTRFGRASH